MPTWAALDIRREVKDPGSGLESYVDRRQKGGVKLHVRATPNARRNEVLGWDEEPKIGRVLRVKIAAPPIEGKANEALREFLAKELGLSRSRVTLEKGEGSRHKIFSLPDGISLPW